MTQQKGQGGAKSQGHINNHTGQSHERDQLGGAFAGKQNERDLSKNGTKEKNRKQEDHDKAEIVYDDDGGII